MRLLLAILGTISILTGGAAFYLGTQQQSGEDRTQSAIRQALKSQVKAVASETEEIFGSQKKQIETLLDPALDRRARIRLIEQGGGPEFLLVRNEIATTELKAKRAVISEEAKAAAFVFFSKEAKIGFWEGMDKSQFVFLKGEAAGQQFVGVYRQNSLFMKLGGSAAIRPWLALADGTILYHGTVRHTGVNSANVRPVAQGAESLRRGQQSEMLASYVGLEGQEILGAWITLPEWGLVVGSEWPTLASARAGISWFTYIAIAAFLFGAFLIGSCVTPRPIQVTAAQRQVKDLSHESRAFIKKAERQAEQALKFAGEREVECSDLESKARAKLQYAERLRWVFEKTEAFLDEAIDAKEDQQVWSLLANYLSSMALRSPVVVFTFSNSSCSLIPRVQAATEVFPEPARRYLEDARLLIGDLSALSRVESTAAFAQWRERLERFQPLEGRRLFTLPFASPTGSRGVVFFLFDEKLMSDAEIEKQRELWSLFAYRAAWLYDMKKRLVQSKNASRRVDKTASARDRTRDRSPTT